VLGKSIDLQHQFIYILSESDFACGFEKFFIV